MPKYIELENQKGKLQEMLGMSLGKGLGSALNTHFANRSLDAVLHDKALEGAPLSKKLETASSALAPYGDVGKELFQRRVGIAGQEEQEKKGKSIGRLTRGEALSDEDWSRFTPKEVADLRKAYGPSSSVAGKEFEKKRGGNVADYVKKSLDESQEAQELNFSLATARKAAQGEVSGPGLKAYAKNNPYMSLIVGLTPDEATLLASNKKLLEGTKSIFGNKPTEREIFLLLNSMLPSIGKSKEANLAGIDFIQKVNDLKALKGEIVNQLTQGGARYVPDLESQVLDKMSPLIDQLHKELLEANQRFNPSASAQETKIKVRAPDRSIGSMTQKQIDAAKAQGVNFERID